MNPTFSIIIPHKDIPDLLMRCLRSIPVSEDIQVIVVDDNSADANTYLDRYPELSRPYLEFIRTTKGGGAGYARNVGLDHAKGKWLLFADADDFFVDNMHETISSYAESKADVIYFKKESVFSENINIESDRCSYVNRIINRYLSNGDEWSIRAKMVVPWGKMIKMCLIDKYNIRFDEVLYGNDVFFSLQTGYYAEIVQAANCVLYVLTSRHNSLAASFCTKPDELRIRSEAAFRCDKFMFRKRFSKERMITPYLWRMLKQDRELFKYYFYKIDEIYPSKLAALNDIRKGHSVKYQILLYIYAFWIWVSLRNTFRLKKRLIFLVY